jgi:hypothetical protein
MGAMGGSEGPTLEGGMEQEATGAHEQVAGVGDQEDAIVTLPDAAANAFYSQAYEQEICKGVDDLGGIDGGIVILGPC